MIPPYHAELFRIRRALELAKFGEDCPKFPENGCDIAMMAVNLVLGLKAVRGEYTPSRSPHNWNHDTDLGLFVDLALDQFDRVNQGVVIMPDSTHLLVVDNEKTSHLPEGFHRYGPILAPFFEAYRTFPPAALLNSP